MVAARRDHCCHSKQRNQKERTDDRDDNDDQGPDKRRRIYEIRAKEVFPLGLPIAYQATFKIWNFSDLSMRERVAEVTRCFNGRAFRVQGIAGVSEHNLCTKSANEAQLMKGVVTHVNVCCMMHREHMERG